MSTPSVSSDDGSNDSESNQNQLTIDVPNKKKHKKSQRTQFDLSNLTDKVLDSDSDSLKNDLEDKKSISPKNMMNYKDFMNNISSLKILKNRKKYIAKEKKSMFTYGTSTKPIVFKLKLKNDFCKFYQMYIMNPMQGLLAYFNEQIAKVESIKKFKEEQAKLIEEKKQPKEWTDQKTIELKNEDYLDTLEFKVDMFLPPKNLYKTPRELNKIVNNNDGSANIFFDIFGDVEADDGTQNDLVLKITPQDFDGKYLKAQYEKIQDFVKIKNSVLANKINTIIQDFFPDMDLKEDLHDLFEEENQKIYEKITMKKHLDNITMEWARLFTKKLQKINNSSKNIILHMAEYVYRSNKDLIRPLTFYELAYLEYFFSEDSINKYTSTDYIFNENYAYVEPPKTLWRYFKDFFNNMDGLLKDKKIQKDSSQSSKNDEDKSNQNKSSSSVIINNDKSDKTAIENETEKDNTEIEYWSQGDDPDSETDYSSSNINIFVDPLDYIGKDMDKIDTLDDKNLKDLEESNLRKTKILPPLNMIMFSSNIINLEDMLNKKSELYAYLDQMNVNKTKRDELIKEMANFLTFVKQKKKNDSGKSEENQVQKSNDSDSKTSNDGIYSTSFEEIKKNEYSQKTYDISIKDVFVEWFKIKRHSITHDPFMQKIVRSIIKYELELFPSMIYQNEIIPRILKASNETQLKVMGVSSVFEKDRIDNTLGYMEMKMPDPRLKKRVFNVLRKFANRFYLEIMDKSKVFLTKKLVEKVEKFLMIYADMYFPDDFNLIKKIFYGAKIEKKESKLDNLIEEVKSDIENNKYMEYELERNNMLEDEKIETGFKLFKSMMNGTYEKYVKGVKQKTNIKELKNKKEIDEKKDDNKGKRKALHFYLFK